MSATSFFSGPTATNLIPSHGYALTLAVGSPGLSNGYRLPEPAANDHPNRPMLRQGAAKPLPLVDFPGSGIGSSVTRAVGASVRAPQLDDVPGTPLVNHPFAFVMPSSAQAEVERNYGHFRRDERVRVANCSGMIASGNCTGYPGGLFYDTPNGEWWNQPYTGLIGNPGYDFSGGQTIDYIPNSTWATNGGHVAAAAVLSETRDEFQIYRATWNNCNCGPSVGVAGNCYSNCNCNCGGGGP